MSRRTLHRAMSLLESSEKHNTNFNIIMDGFDDSLGDYPSHYRDHVACRQCALGNGVSPLDRSTYRWHVHVTLGQCFLITKGSIYAEGKEPLESEKGLSRLVVLSPGLPLVVYITECIIATEICVSGTRVPSVLTVGNQPTQSLDTVHLDSACLNLTG